MIIRICESLQRFNFIEKMKCLNKIRWTMSQGSDSRTPTRVQGAKILKFRRDNTEFIKAAIYIYDSFFLNHRIYK